MAIMSFFMKFIWARHEISVFITSASSEGLGKSVNMSAAFTSLHIVFSQLHVHTQSMNVDKDSDQNLDF